METIIRKVLSKELKLLCEMDREIFDNDAYVSPLDWRGAECFWLIINGERVGSIAFRHDTSARGAACVKSPGSLYLESTGLLSRCRGMRLGALLADWQIAYARYHGFSEIILHTRASNVRMIALSKTRGYKIKSRIKNYYDRPKEDAFLMKLVL